MAEREPGSLQAPRPCGSPWAQGVLLYPRPILAEAGSGSPQHSPLQLLQGHGDPQAVAQHVESSQDVCPLHHLPQGPALQHPRAKHVPRLLRQEADVHEDLPAGQRGSV